MLTETKSSKAWESRYSKKNSECTLQILSLVNYKTKPQQHLYKSDVEVLNGKRNMDSF